MYQHINHDIRVALVALKKAGLSNAECAREIGVHRSTIGRELLRNSSDNNEYSVRYANKHSLEKRKHSKLKYRSIENNKEVILQIEGFLKLRTSPEQIAGTYNISTHTTIYSWIKRSRPDLRQYLRRKGKKRRVYGTSHIKSRYQANKRSIHERPMIVQKRYRVGDWEGDTARGKDRKSALLVYTERKSGFVEADRLKRATSDAVHTATKVLLSNTIIHTITYDNGSEFALHKMIERDLGVNVYFADKGKPYQRGTNENSIGLLREFFPKAINFGNVTDRQVSEAVWNINHRPRKRHSWRTPCEVYGGCCT